MEDKIALFLSRFNRVKKEVHNVPKTLQWLAPEKPELQDLCHELDSTYRQISEILATKSSKHTFIKSEFEEQWLEYKRNYADLVSSAGEPATSRELAQRDKVMKQKFISEGKIPEEYVPYEWLCDRIRELEKQIPPGHHFNPLEDDPSELVKDAKNLVVEILQDNFYRDTYDA